MYISQKGNCTLPLTTFQSYTDFIYIQTLERKYIPTLQRNLDLLMPVIFKITIFIKTIYLRYSPGHIVGFISEMNQRVVVATLLSKINLGKKKKKHRIPRRLYKQ